ncbi:hypothetical protein BSL78_03759 [Apostichopus japonicus]|uniref:Uncharacterized protein n=1 Tax=Stichopus japonicus TaxID=307972 RepID=A0A2G8LGN6_STIJA|nr:hypothetical protein BSL78_03759 [Apostichopus japonicus]
MVLQQEDTDTIVKRRLNTLYAKYNLSVDDFDKWNYSSSDHLFDNSVLRPVANNYTQEHVIAINAPRNSINFHFQPVKPDVKNSVKDVLRNKTKGIRLGEKDIKDLQLVGQENDDKQKTEDEDINTEDKSSPELTKEELEEAVEQFQAIVPPVEESEEEDETEEDRKPVKKVKTVAKKPGKKEAKVPKKVVAPKKSTKTKKVVAPKKPTTKRKEIVPPKNATKKVVAEKKTAPVKKVVVPKKADAKKTKKTVKAKVPAEDPKKPKVARKKVETPKKKVAKPSLKDKVKAKKKTKTSVKRKVTDEQGREMEEELYKLAPEVFDFVPREFEADVSSPSGLMMTKTRGLPYFYVIGMPTLGLKIFAENSATSSSSETSMSATTVE